MEVRVYTPRREESIYQVFKNILAGFREGRELAWRLFVRDQKANFRKSFLGYFWLFLPPLATAGIWIFLNEQRVVTIQDTPMKYPAFTLCGTLLWSLFAEAVSKPIQRHQGAMSIMTKLNFPRESIILASLYDLGLSLFLRLLILIPALWILGYPPTLNFLPGLLAVIALGMAGFAIGLFLTPVGLLYTDIGKGLPIILPFAMYLTPVIYPLRESGWLMKFQWVNPVTPFLELARSLFGNYSSQMHSELTIWSSVVVGLFFISLVVVRIALPFIIERSGS